MIVPASRKPRSPHAAPFFHHPLAERKIVAIGGGVFMVISLGIGIGNLALPGKAVAAQTTPVLLAQGTKQNSQTVLHVNPTTGNDRGNGSDLAPFKTITQALQVAQPHTVILLASGTYSATTGEVFPLVLRPHITIQGNPETRGQDVVIQGGGLFSSPGASQNIAVLGGANQAALIGVTITNPGGYGIQIISSNPTVRDSTLTGNAQAGIYLAGNSTSLIRNNFFAQNRIAGISIHNSSRPTVEDNIFEQNGEAIAIHDSATPLIANNRVTQNKIGIALRGTGQPTLRNNSLEENGQNELRAEQVKDQSLGLPSRFAPANPVQQPAVSATAQNRISAVPFGTPLPTKPTPSDPPPEKSVLPKQPQSWQISPPAMKSDVAATGFPVPRALLPTIPAAQTPASSQGSTKLLTPPPPPLRSLSTAPPPSALTKPAESKSGKVRSTNVATADVIVPTISIKTAEIPVASRTAFPPSSNSNPPGTIAPAQGSTSSQMFPQPASSNDLPTVQVRNRKVKPVGQPSAEPVQPPIAVAPKAIATARRLPSVPAQAPSLPINIPVPPPESKPPESKPISSVITNSSPMVSPPAIQARQPARTADLLPVPGPNAPIGNVGDMPSVYGDRNLPNADRSALTHPTGSSAMVKYRVVVFTTNDQQQAQLRSLVPNAFSSTYRGQTVMQAGAFGDRSKADQLMTTLTSQGLQTIIEPMP